MHLGRTTLSKFLIQQLDGIEGATDLGALLVDVAAAVKAISAMTAKGALGGFLGEVGTRNIQGEVQQKLDLLANDVMLRSCDWGGLVAGMASEELEEPYAVPAGYPRGRYLLVFDPLDGSSNTDVNVSVGTIFSVLRHDKHEAPATSDFLQAGRHLLAARLQEVARGRCRRLVMAQHREDGADRDIHVGVRGAVERIEHQQVAAARVARGHRVRVLELFGSHARHQAAPVAAAQHDVVGQQVELLLHLALDVARAYFAEEAAQRALGGHRRDRLDGGGDVDKQRAEVVGALDAVELLDEELRERGASQVHGRVSLQVAGFRGLAGVWSRSQSGRHGSRGCPPRPVS